MCCAEDVFDVYLTFFFFNEAVGQPKQQTIHPFA
jgi:hypothetical protein